MMGGLGWSQGSEAMGVVRFQTKAGAAHWAHADCWSGFEQRDTGKRSYIGIWHSLSFYNEALNVLSCYQNIYFI